MATTVSRAKKAAGRGAKKATAKKTPARKAVAKKTAARKTAAKKTTARKAPVKKAATKKAAAKTGIAKKAARRQEATSKVATKKAATKKTAPRKVATKQAAPRRATAKPRPAKRITPEQALDNTRRLLEAKHAHDGETPPWQALEARHGTTPHAGFQDGQARDQANELHAGESDMQAIQGAIGTRDRHNQGKRDKR